MICWWVKLTQLTPPTFLSHGGVMDDSAKTGCTFSATKDSPETKQFHLENFVYSSLTLVVFSCLNFVQSPYYGGSYRVFVQQLGFCYWVLCDHPNLWQEFVELMIKREAEKETPEDLKQVFRVFDKVSQFMEGKETENISVIGWKWICVHFWNQVCALKVWTNCGLCPCWLS